jgi:OOP family OmpA-OmpF porin
MKKVTLLALALGFGLLTYAQESTTPDNQTEKDSTRKYRSWSIGADFGWSLLFGDMHQLETNKKDYYGKDGEFGRFGGFDPGFSLNIQKWYSSAWGWRARGGWMSYSGTKTIYAVKSTSTFRGDLSVQLNLSGIGQRNRNKPDRKDAWIVNAGVGYTWANAVVYKEGKEYLKLGSDNYNEFDFGNAKAKAEKTHNSVYMPFGLEWRYRFAERWDLKVAADFLWAMDDNFDGSKTTVKNDYGKSSPPEKNIQDLAFDNTTNDFLGYFNVGVNYHFSWFSPHVDPTPIIYVGPGLDPRVDKLVDDMDKIMTDKDNDGVSDYFDKEPETPEGYMVYGGGQAVDQDKDGIADEIDEDPYTTKGAKVDANGREYDADGDGVYDAADKEPNSKPGAFVNYQGVTIVDKIGGGGSGEAFLPMIYFDFDKANVTNANYERLATVARFLEANPNAKLNVYGHTDKVGGEQYNNKLSDRRAAAAKNALINDFGISADRFVEVKGEGKSQLWSKRDGVNRRVEFQIAK